MLAGQRSKGNALRLNIRQRGQTIGWADSIFRTYFRAFKIDHVIRRNLLNWRRAEKCFALNPQPSTLNPQPSTLNRSAVTPWYGFVTPSVTP